MFTAALRSSRCSHVSDIGSQGDSAGCQKEKIINSLLLFILLQRLAESPVYAVEGTGVQQGAWACSSITLFIMHEKSQCSQGLYCEGFLAEQHGVMLQHAVSLHCSTNRILCLLKGTWQDFELTIAAVIFMGVICRPSKFGPWQREQLRYVI